MTFQEAKELAIKKWQFIVDNNGNLPSNEELFGKFPELESMPSHCPYCLLYYKTSIGKLDNCAFCPLRPFVPEYDDKTQSGCRQLKSVHWQWWINQNKETAQAVLDKIKNS